MADVLTVQQRSFCMSRNKGRDTGPEVQLRKALWRRGLRYRLRNQLPGRPDIVFPGAKLAVFVDGCFWHACPIHSVMPKSNASFWAVKITRNKIRDSAVNQKLVEAGWAVVRVWEHDIRSSLDIAADTVATIMSRRG